MKTIILLIVTAGQQLALTKVLREHNPALSFRCVLAREELTAIEPEVLRTARLVAFTSGIIVPHSILAALGYGAYNFHPGPPNYPGWAPAHFALYDGARTFGATAHVMTRRVDSGPILGTESFIIPDNVSVREPRLSVLAPVARHRLRDRAAADLADRLERHQEHAADV